MIALGVLWIALSLALPLSRVATAVLAAIALVAAAAAVQTWGKGAGDAESAGPVDRWRRLTPQKKTNALAAIAALLVFAGATIGLLSQPIPDTNSKRAQGDATTTTTKSHEVGVNKGGKTVKLGKTKVVEAKESEVKPDESLLGKAVDNPAGVVLVRLGLALLAGFIAGLAVQRVLLGKYAVTLPFGLGGVQEITPDTTNPLADDANKDRALRNEIVKAKDASEEPGFVPDPQRVMVGLGLDMTSALREKATDLDVSPDISPELLIDHLEEKTELGPSGALALRKAIDLSDRAYQGAKLAPGAEEWVTDMGQFLPEAIKSLKVTD